MVNFSYSDLRFKHQVIFKEDDCILAAANEPCSRRIRLFLIFNDRKVYIRNGIQNNWEPVGEYATEAVVGSLNQAVGRGLTTFYLHSTCAITAGISN